MAEGVKEQELDGNSVLSRSLVISDGTEDVLGANMSVPLLPPMSSPEDNKDLPTTLAQDLGHSMEDGGYQSPRLAGELPLVSESSVITQSLESNGVVLGLLVLSL